MSEKRFTIKPQDDYWAVVDNYNDDKVCIINGIHTEIEAEWLCDFMNEQQATITNLQGDVERLKYIIEELRKDNYNKFELINKMKKEEKLYAKEILRLNELNKQTSDFTDILGGY